MSVPLAPFGVQSPGAHGRRGAAVAESVAGKLLVASPELLDPNFLRSVVLILLHDEGGAFGLILNRPSAVAVDAHLPAWPEHAAAPAVIFEGGPVSPESAIGLAAGRVRGVGDGWNGMPHGLGLVDLERVPGDVEADIERARIFAGYAGWSPGQLEDELKQNAWFTVGCEPGDVFSADPDGLWRDVLLRQPGKLAMFAFAPIDPRVN